MGRGKGKGSCLDSEANSPHICGRSYDKADKKTVEEFMKFRTILLALATSIPLAQFTAGAQPTNAAAPSPIGPRIQFAEPVYDFGKAVSGAVITHEFIFTNTGDATLEITKVVPGCHCTTAGDWTRHVAPGQTGIVPIRFDSKGFNGPITRVPTVVSNDRQHPTTSFQLKGTIWVPFVMTPGYVVFSFPQGSKIPATNIVHIVSSVPEPVTLSEPTNHHSGSHDRIEHH